MKWVRFRVRTTPEAEDVIVSEMNDIGMCGAQIEDNVPLTASEKERIYTFDADDPQNKEIAEGEAYVSFYAELNEDGQLRVELSPDDEFFERVSLNDEGDVLTSEDETDIKTGQQEDTENRILENGLCEVYMTPDEQLKRMEDCLAAIKEYMEIGAGTVAVSQMDDAAWKDKWKEYFHSFMIDDILVTPSWEEEPQDLGKANYVLHIDPGTAFGTGAHETTQLAIRAIRKLIDLYKTEYSKQHVMSKASADGQNTDEKASSKAIRLLDIGTGSGILSIMALMFGAESCVGTDLDPFTEEAVRENLETNHIDKDRFKLILGNIIDDDEVRSLVLKESSANRNKTEELENCSQDPAINSAAIAETDATCKEGYEIVVANILPVVLVPLTPTVPPFIKPGGYYVTSGILNEKKEMMENIIKEAGLEIVETTSQGEWCSITAKKPR